MRGVGQFEKSSASLASAACVGLTALLVLFAFPSTAQMHGPPITTTIGGHFLGPPPNVTSLAGRYLPPPLPSVTSIPNYGYARWYPSAPYYNGSYRGRGYGYGRGGYAYAVPYYVPLDGYGYDYMGGPDLYSGPPIGPNDPLFHIVAEQPPGRYPYGEPDPAQVPPIQAQPAPEQASIPDAKPNEPSVLVFRDGHKQEVSNYAIMGQTVYVFDKRTQKIALADLDVSATVAANDDRGLEFKIPPQKSQPKSSDVQQKSAPDEGTKAPANMAAMAP